MNGATRYVLRTGPIVVGRLPGGTATSRGAVALGSRILIPRESAAEILVVALAEDQREEDSVLRDIETGVVVRTFSFDTPWGGEPRHVEGGVLVTPLLARRLLEAFDASVSGLPPSRQRPSLSAGERSVLNRLASGLSLNDVAGVLGLSGERVETRVRDVIERLVWQSRLDGPELQGTGVPRRPAPGSRTAAATAAPEPDALWVRTRRLPQDGDTNC